MAEDLVDLFSDIPPEITWLVCQRCLHGRWAWHLRCCVEPFGPPWGIADDYDFAVLVNRIKEYPPPTPKKRAPRWTHLGPGTCYEAQKLLMRLCWFLTRKISDDEADKCRQKLHAAILSRAAQ